MLINDVAKHYRITVRTLRYYEELGLLKLGRTDANIRVFNEKQLNRLEEILLLKMFNLSLQDIGSIMASEDRSLLNKHLTKELNHLTDTINDLQHRRRLVHSLLSTYGSRDISKQNLKEFINEQIYFKNERMITMITKAENISLEISEALIPLASSETGPSLIPEIKKLRTQLKSDHGIDLAVVHIKDNPELNGLEFQIMQNEKIILKDTCVGDSLVEQVVYIIKRLESLLA